VKLQLIVLHYIEQELQNEQQNIKINNKEKDNQQSGHNNINEIKMNNINNKFDYFKNTKDIYDKLFIHEYIENIHLIENNQELMDKKLNYLKMNKDYYNNKKQEINFKLQLKRRTKNLFYEELSKGKKSEKNDSYFHISPEAFEYNHNNKNILYKSDGLVKI
jgi:hypothetical protein